MNEIKLTAYSKGSGCGCKLSPSDLRQILASEMTLPSHPALLAGLEHNEDAAVWKWDDEYALISTTDFFTPIVDDPFAFGKIAASNALSDVYAMGGSPFMALAILGWPIGKIPMEAATQIMEGARLVCNVAGVQLSGGHSIESSEPIFGLSVNGKATLNHIKKNDGAQIGDILFLTKPLGNGIIAAAQKKEKADSAEIEEAIRFMTQLNDIGATLGRYEKVHAMTDVTGFGLLGHLIEMMQASGTSAHLHFDRIPTYPFLNKYLEQFIYPDITTKNFSAFSAQTTTLNANQLFTVCDPQTSGGLLISVDPTFEKELISIMKDFSIASNCLTPIGRVCSLEEKTISIL